MNKRNSKVAQRTPLREQLNQIYWEFLSKLNEDSRKKVVNSLERLSDSHIGGKAKTVGDTAPDFSVKMDRGNIRLYEVLKFAPVVLSFYRGGWCPFCNLELKELQAYLPDIKVLGAYLIAISPESNKNILSTIDRNMLDFDLLPDRNNNIARDYGLTYMVDKDLLPLYEEWGINLSDINEVDSCELPIPATYVIARDRIIQAAYVERDYSRRMEPKDVVIALEAIKRKPLVPQKIGK